MGDWYINTKLSVPNTKKVFYLHKQNCYVFFLSFCFTEVTGLRYKCDKMLFTVGFKESSLHLTSCWMYIWCGLY